MGLHQGSDFLQQPSAAHTAPRSSKYVGQSVVGGRRRVKPQESQREGGCSAEQERNR